jgi:hypothetical protein
MIRWQYWTGFIYSDIRHEGAMEFLRREWPKWNPPKYTPQAMIPELNALGEQGWELVHMEPVPEVGGNADVGFVSGGEGSHTHWSHAYFCVFKRPSERQEAGYR